MAGGEKDWLEGINSQQLPAKLRNITNLCVEMAYKPWILKDGVKLVKDTNKFNITLKLECSCERIRSMV